MRIVGLIGRSGAGKNTVAGMLAAELIDRGFTVRLDAFGLPIKRHVRSEYGAVDKVDHRELMQQLGGFMRGCRNSYFEDEFVRRNGLPVPFAHEAGLTAPGEPANFLIAPDILPLLSVERLQAPGKLPGKNRKPPKAVELGQMFGVLKKVEKQRPDMGLFLKGMAHFGLRPENVCGFRRKDATLPRGRDKGRLFVRGIKGAPDRWISLPAEKSRTQWVRDCLALGKRLDKDKALAPLVPCASGRSRRNPGGWTTGALDMAMGRLLRRLKIRFTPYQIRHTCMTGLLRRGGVALANTQAYAGHTKATTQDMYVQLAGKDAEPAFDEMEKIMEEYAMRD